MNSKELFDYQSDFFGKCISLTKSKNHDYTSASDDALSNFKVVQQYGITPEQGLLTRMSDKMMRIATFINKGTLKVDDEKIQDTLQDLANYASLLGAYIESKNNEQ